MINVQLGSKQEEKPFPKLMISKLGTIVLFIKYGLGVRIYDVDNEPIIYHEWAMSAFTDYNEPVTLQNA